jgi:hypothetical protein
MALFAFSTWVAIASVAYSYYNQQQAKKAQEKARREAEQRADLAKGFQFTEEGQAKALPIVYGRNKIGGVRVHFKVTDSYLYSPPAAGGIAFESMKQPENAEPLVYRLVNSSGDWGGSWSLVPSSVAEFNNAPGWIVTKEDLYNWKYPDRAYVNDQVTYSAPSVDFVYCTFMYGTNTATRPWASLVELGFSFPQRSGTEPVLVSNQYGEKNEFYFIQQALSQGGLHNIYTFDVDQKPYSFSGYSYGLRVHAYRDGDVADPMMYNNDASRINARFYGTAYATGVFKLNRDDPQYNGTPDLQFYVEGNKVRTISFVNGAYELSAERVYSNNPALVLLDYLTNPLYGKGISDTAIDLEAFYNAATICGIKIKSGVQRKGSLWLTKGGIRDIYLYECNVSLDSSANFRDNVQKILDTMGLATLVWSEGKYRLNLPYAFLYQGDVTYNEGEIVQYTVNNENRLYRAKLQSTGKTPLTNPDYWVEDVIPDGLKRVNDEDLLLGSEVLISWPNADTKLNFATVRFLNEEQDFAEDTMSWPEKEPVDGSDTIYSRFISEDNGVPLEAEIFEAGCTTPYHAKALAEQRVRASRETVTYTFKAIARVFTLEPGDLFGFESNTFSIPYCVLKVDDIETEEGGIVKVTASTFDANLLAWNIADDFYSPLRNDFEGYVIKQATNLQISVGNTNNRTSNYVLTWDRAADSRVNRYIVKYTTDSINNVTSTSAWIDLGTTSANSFELPALDGQFTFTVVSLTADNRSAPFKNLSEGSSWPLLSYTLSSAFLAGVSSIRIIASNSNHEFLTDASGAVRTHAGSGTEIQCFQGSTALIYDGSGETEGTFNVFVASSNAKGLQAGTIAVKSNDPTTAIVGPHNSFTSATGSITYTVTGRTINGSSFTYYVQQLFTKRVSSELNTYYSISGSSNVFYKNAASANLAGTYSSITVSGLKVVSGASSNFGYLTVTADLESESSTAQSGPIAIEPGSASGVSKYTVRLYDTQLKTTLLDSQDFFVVYKGEKGSGAITAILSNATHAVPADSVGNVTSYDNSGTDLYVYEGAARLAYNPNWNGETGQWKITASASNISASGSRTDNGDFVTIGNHSNMTAETAAVVFTINGKSSENINFEISVTQTLIKAKSGATAIDARLSNEYFAFSTDEYGTITSYSGTGTTIAVYEGASKLTYDGIGTANGTWKVIAGGTGITPSNAISIVNSTDASFGVASNMSADTAYIDFTIIGKSSTGASFTLYKRQTFNKRKQGVTGEKSATVYLYQWATVLPATPTGTSTFTWSSLSNSNYTKAQGATDYWSTTIPSNPGTPLLKLWRAEKLIIASNSATTSSISWTTGITIADVTQNGQAGLNVADATLYKWAATIPAAPTGTNTFTWSTGAFDAVSSTNSNDGWTKTPGTAVAGYTLWAAVVRLSDVATNSTTTINWTTASVQSRAYAGTNGLTGNQGASYRLAFAKSTTQTATAQTITTAGNSSFPGYQSWGLSGATWSALTPSLSAGEFLWQSDGIYDPATGNTTWSTPYWSSLKVGNLSAISANMGTLTSGKIQSNDGKFVIDLDNKTINIEV